MFQVEAPFKSGSRVLIDLCDWLIADDHVILSAIVPRWTTR